MIRSVDPHFWNGKKVFITGHTGFKGSWLTYWLHLMGAKVFGYALAPDTEPSMFNVLRLKDLIEESHIADIRDLETLSRAIKQYQPNILIHMAAQPLVRYSYINPVETYQINVMGTVNVLESLRSIASVRSSIIVTTDKCYENKEWQKSYTENDAMGGYDPYSSSKGCAELITSAYRRSFFNSPDCLNSLATVRAGNVIGGGDWSKDRLIPDAIRAFESRNPLMIRNPKAIRPWQHVLEPLSGYLVLAQALYEQGVEYASSWNFGPNIEDAITVGELLDIFRKHWGREAAWNEDRLPQPHEAQILKLDCSKAKDILGWSPQWDLEETLQRIVVWHEEFANHSDMRLVTKSDISAYQFKQLRMF